MLINRPPQDSTYDLVVVGTGFGSLFYLKRYQELYPGARILVLERGKYHTREWQLEQGQNSEIGYTDTYQMPEGQKRWSTTIALGGGTLCWWGITPRMSPEDFKMRSNFGVGVDWPITYDELVPYYRQAEQIMMISGPNDLEGRFPGTAPYPARPHHLSTPDELLKAASPNTHFAVPSARLREPVGSRGACCSTSRCHLCPMDAKFNALNAMMDVLGAENTFVLTDAEVTHLDIQNDVVKSVTYSHDGQDFSASGDLVVLGANAIQSPYLLQKSGDTHPVLGRYLHEKLSAIFEVHLDGVDAFDGGQASTGLNYGLYDSADRSQYGAATFYTENHWGTGLRTEYGRWRQILPLFVVIEDIPQEHNGVTVGDGSAPFVDHPDWSDYAYRGLDKVKENLPDVLSGLPVESVSMAYQLVTASHVQGTMRMGEDPETSIVDKDLIHHRVRNLTCVGTSVWSSCGVANPSLTAAALSLRAANTAFASQEDPS